MADSIRVRTQVKTIENPSIDAYRQHLKDRSIDYHLEVKKESEQARRSLREKARKEALKRQYYQKNIDNTEL